MGRKLVPLGAETLDLVPEPCRRCVFWELGAKARPRGSEDAALQKEAWLSSVVLEWGPAGHVVSVDGEVAGYSLFAPTHLLEQVGFQAARPVSRDAVLLATGPDCANQAFRLGDSQYGLQFHPEVNPEIVRDWVSRAEGATQAEIDAIGREMETQIDRHLPEAAAFARDLARNWLELVRRKNSIQDSSARSASSVSISSSAPLPSIGTSQT